MTPAEDALTGPRAAMVDELRHRYGMRDEGILAAMLTVRRHVFIPATHRANADPYGDHPCPIGYGQTISQPYIVAYMTARIEIQPGDRVLEIGTGSGYQAAILAELGANVCSLEIVAPLAEHARTTLQAEGYAHVEVRLKDGREGCLERAPFDVIIATCAPEEVPPALTDQLGEYGRMILPLGVLSQQLVILRKRQDGISLTRDIMVRFVPMIMPAHPMRAPG